MKNLKENQGLAILLGLILSKSYFSVSIRTVGLWRGSWIRSLTAINGTCVALQKITKTDKTGVLISSLNNPTFRANYRERDSEKVLVDLTTFVVYNVDTIKYRTLMHSEALIRPCISVRNDSNIVKTGGGLLVPTERKI